MEKGREIGTKSRQGVYWGIGLKTVHQVFHFIVFVVIARVLGPGAFGQMALAMTAVVLANNIAGGGFTKAIVQRKEISSTLINAVFTFNLILSLVMVLVFLGIAPFMESLFSSPGLTEVVYALVVLFPITSIYHIGMGLLLRDLRYHLHFKIEAVCSFTQSISSLLLALNGYDVWSLVIGQIAGHVIATVVLLGLGRWTPGLTWKLMALRDVSHYGSMSLVMSQIRYLEEFLPYWIGGYAFGSGQLGLFERAYAIVSMPLARIMVQVNAVFFSSFSRLKDQRERLLYAIRKSYTAVGLIASPMMMGMALVSRHFVLALLGEEWETMVIPMQILCMATLFKIMAGNLININTAVGTYARQAKSSLMMLLIYGILCLMGVRWGIAGLAAASLVSAVILLYVSGKIAVEGVGMKWNAIVSTQATSFLGSAFMGVVLGVMGGTVLIDSTVSNLISMIIVGAVVYAIWIAVFPSPMTKDVIRDVVIDLKAVARNSRKNRSER